MTEGLVPEWSVAGLTRKRTGAVLQGIAPSNGYPTTDGEVIVAANQDSLFARLCAVMGQPDLTTDPRFADHRARGEHATELDELIATWTRTRPSADLLAALHAAAVPAGLVFTPADMAADPHFAFRKALVEVEDPEVGPLLMPAPAPRLSRTPSRVRWAGPRLGQHTEQVLQQAGLTEPDVAALRAAGAI